MQLFCNQIAVVASSSGWAEPVDGLTVAGPSSEDSGELDDELLDDPLDDDDEEDGADEVVEAALLTAAPDADDAVPAVGAEQATVNAAAASRAAAAMPWRRFTGAPSGQPAVDGRWVVVVGLPRTPVAVHRPGGPARCPDGNKSMAPAITYRGQ